MTGTRTVTLAPELQQLLEVLDDQLAAQTRELLVPDRVELLEVVEEQVGDLCRLTEVVPAPRAPVSTAVR